MNHDFSKEKWAWMMKASRPLWIHHPSSVPLSGTGFENRFK
jgi:hypothetical protein